MKQIILENVVASAHEQGCRTKITSEGQTGVDCAALDFAIQHGYEHGGWCPRGRRAEDGVIPPIYRLRETDSVNYDKRTERTLWIRTPR